MKRMFAKKIASMVAERLAALSGDGNFDEDAEAWEVPSASGTENLEALSLAVINDSRHIGGTDDIAGGIVLALTGFGPDSESVREYAEIAEAHIAGPVSHRTGKEPEFRLV